MLDPYYSIPLIIALFLVAGIGFGAGYKGSPQKTFFCSKLLALEIFSLIGLGGLGGYPLTSAIKNDGGTLDFSIESLLLVIVAVAGLFLMVYLCAVIFGFCTSKLKLRASALP